MVQNQELQEFSNYFSRKAERVGLSTNKKIDKNLVFS